VDGFGGIPFSTGRLNQGRLAGVGRRGGKNARKKGWIDTCGCIGLDENPGQSPEAVAGRDGTQHGLVAFGEREIAVGGKAQAHTLQSVPAGEAFHAGLDVKTLSGVDQRVLRHHHSEPGQPGDSGILHGDVKARIADRGLKQGEPAAVDFGQRDGAIHPHEAGQARRRRNPIHDPAQGIFGTRKK